MTGSETLCFLCVAFSAGTDSRGRWTLVVLTSQYFSKCCRPAGGVGGAKE